MEKAGRDEINQPKFLWNRHPPLRKITESTTEHIICLDSQARRAHNYDVGEHRKTTTFPGHRYRLLAQGVLTKVPEGLLILGLPLAVLSLDTGENSGLSWACIAAGLFFLPQGLSALFSARSSNLHLRLFFSGLVVALIAVLISLKFSLCAIITAIVLAGTIMPSPRIFISAPLHSEVRYWFGTTQHCEKNLEKISLQIGLQAEIVYFACPISSALIWVTINNSNYDLSNFSWVLAVTGFLMILLSFWLWHAPSDRTFVKHTGRLSICLGEMALGCAMSGIYAVLIELATPSKGWITLLLATFSFGCGSFIAFLLEYRSGNRTRSNRILSPTFLILLSLLLPSTLQYNSWKLFDINCAQSWCILAIFLAIGFLCGIILARYDRGRSIEQSSGHDDTKQVSEHWAGLGTGFLSSGVCVFLGISNAGCVVFAFSSVVLLVCEILKNRNHSLR